MIPAAKTRSSHELQSKSENLTDPSGNLLMHRHTEKNIRQYDVKMKLRNNTSAI